MKKILLAIILIINITNINAKTYYSPYSEYSEYQIHPVEQSDTTKVDIQKRFKLYLEYITYDYLYSIESTNLKKLDEYIQKKSDWTYKRPEEQIDRIINSKTVYQYQEVKKVRYLHFYEMFGNYNRLAIGEIQIFDTNDNLIDYLDTCINCDPEFYEDARESLNDNYFFTAYLTFGLNDILTLDLQDYYSMDELKIRIYIYDTSFETIKKWKIKYTSEEDFNSTDYAIGEITEQFKDEYILQMKPHDCDFSSMNITHPEYDDIKISEVPIPTTTLRKVEQKLQYQSIDTLYKYEIIEKEYLNNYYLEPFDNFKIDESLNTLYYRYQTRDKVIIKDNLIIDNYDIDLSSFIEYKTTDDIKITSNINLYRNGTYKINFILPWKTITEDITVDIKKNYIKALEEQNKALKELEQQNNEIYIKINQTNSNIKEVLEDKDKEINEVNEKLIEYQYQNKELKQNKQELKEIKQDNNNKKYLLILPLIPILIIIVKIIKNMSNQNNN